LSGAPLGWFGDEEDPVLAGRRLVVTRREARLFSDQGQLQAVLAGRDAVEVRVHAECEVIALRFGGPEYSLRTFSPQTGAMLAEFPWIPARFEPDFDYQPACDGRKILLYSRHSPPLPRSAQQLPDQVLFLGAESAVLGRWTAPQDEEVLSARFSGQGAVTAQVVSRRYGKLFSSRVTPSGRRALLESRPDTVDARREFGAASSTISNENRAELAGRLVGARSLPIAWVEQEGSSTLIVHGDEGRTARLSVTQAASLTGRRGMDGIAQYRWTRSASQDTHEQAPGLARAFVFSGPDGAWVLFHPLSRRQLAIWLIELPAQKGEPEVQMRALVTSPSGTFYAQSDVEPLVYYPSGHELKDAQKAGEERCARQFRPEILSAFLENPSPPHEPQSGAEPSAGGVPDEGGATPCPAGPQVGKMLGSDGR